MDSASHSPPAFKWDDWYAGVGGRTIKIPEVEEILRYIFENQLPRFEGVIAPEKKEFASPEEAAIHIKSKALEFGADIVGICRIEPSDIYRGRMINETFAISVGGRMHYRAFQKVPSLESAIECVRVYQHLGEVVIRLAAYIRSLGYSCGVEHPIGDSNLLHIPIALKSGLGELGRHGSIINPKLGPLFRLGSVATSIPLACDQPINAGIQEFCDNCRACRIYCPAGAIPDERSPEAGKDHLGYDRYVVDTGKCFPYFAKHNYCSACLPVCVFNRKEWAKDFDGFVTSRFPVVNMLPPPLPYDGIPPGEKHFYPEVHRGGTEPSMKPNKKYQTGN